MLVCELTPRFENCKGYYGKALVHCDASGTRLYSYGTLVVTLSRDSAPEFTEYWNYSRTTKRHVREFCRQQGIQLPN